MRACGDQRRTSEEEVVASMEGSARARAGRASPGLYHHSSGGSGRGDAAGSAHSLADHTDNPEFFLRTTVIDAAVGAGADGLFTSSDAQPVSRIRWQINEKVLLARLTYERIENTG